MKTNVLKRFWPLLIVLAVGVVWARSSDIWSLRGRSFLRTVDVIRLTDVANPDLELYSGDFVLKGSELQPSTTAGTYAGLKVYLKNCGSASWVQGSLVTVDDDEAGCGQPSPQTNNLTDWVGIAEGTVAAGSLGYVTVGGLAVALTTGTVNRGDMIVSTQAAVGYMAANTSSTSGADIGVALSSGPTAGGLTVIRLR